MDWRQIWEICSAPDNVPIVGLIPLLGFYIYLAWKQAHANDVLIEQLEGDAALAKTHHRKTWPFKPGWQKEVHVWPFLLRIEFLAAIIVIIILMVWSITLNAPLEEPANPNLTMNPAKAPWYFLGLQEMLVYFDPWIAGVVMPTMIIVGLMVIPYVDTNPLGSGYYTWKQRRFSIGTFLFGFIILWVAMIIIGTFIRGPGNGSGRGKPGITTASSMKSIATCLTFSESLRTWRRQFSVRSWSAATTCSEDFSCIRSSGATWRKTSSA
jgi:hypothetical protein